VKDLTAADVAAARKRVGRLVRRTPLLASARTPGLHLKAESLQLTGSFKIRGALNAVLALPAARAKAGVSCISAGNHGAGVAYAARQREVPCTVYVPPNAVPFKVEAMRALGAEVVEQPVPRLAEMMAAGDSFDGRRFIDPFANPHVAAGQGTCGLEILEDLPRPASVFVPIGGGGLALGIATAVKAGSPRTEVFGVTARGAPAFRNAWETGKIEATRSDTIADGLSAPIANAHVVARLKHLLDGIVTVEDGQLRAAMRRLALEEKLVAEPAGAAATAAALDALGRDGGEAVVAVVSGGNVRPELLAEVLSGGGAAVAAAAPRRTLRSVFRRR
jgi:threonine dehydratase